MAKQRVLLLGATGETGSDVLNGLIEDGGFDVSLLVRPASASKPAIKDLEARGFPIVLSDLSEPVDELASKLKGFDTVISTIDAMNILSQKNLINAAAKAGTKRFLPCAYGSICPPGGVMPLRDVKEEVFNAILVAKVPYTVVDCGFWYSLSFPRVPSGKLDYAKVFSDDRIIGSGDVPNILTDQRDQGRLIARIIKDERTLNQKVVAIGEVLTQNEIYETVEKVTGEKIPRQYLSNEDVVRELEALKATGEFSPLLMIYGYHYSKYVRGDNTPDNARYLGYLDARELYPDFKPISFAQVIRETWEGKAKKPYADRRLDQARDAVSERMQKA